MSVYIVKKDKTSGNEPAFNNIKLNEQGYPIIQGTGLYAQEKKVKISHTNSTRLKGYADDPNVRHRSYGNRGVIEKYFGIPYNILRKICREFTVVASILRLRTYQAHPYSEIWEEENKPGIRVVLKDKKKTPNKEELKEIEEKEEWVYQTGRRDFDTSFARKDRLPQFSDKMIRDVLGIDRVAVTRRIDSTGEVVDFAIIDSSTIKPVDPYVGFNGDTDIKYVQEINGTVVETFKDGEIIVDWMFQTTDTEHQYHGWSALEESYKEIKNTISSLKYNSGNFSDSKIPKGYFVVPDELSETQLDELEERWNSLFQGVESAFRTPFFSGNKDIQYHQVGQSNRDMEYHKYMNLLLLLVYANFSVDPLELGIKLEQSQQVFGDSGSSVENKSSKSKDRGLGAVLDFKIRIMNRIVEGSPSWEKYKIIHTGRKDIDQDAKLESDIKKLGNYATLGEIRDANDKPSLVDLAKKLGIDDEDFLEALKKDELLIFNPQYSTMRNQPKGQEEGYDETGDEEEDVGLESEYDDEEESDDQEGAVDLIQKSKSEPDLFWVEIGE